MAVIKLKHLNYGEGGSAKFNLDKRWRNGPALRHTIRIDAYWIVSPRVNWEVGDVLPLPKVRTRSRLQNLTLRWLRPGLEMSPAGIEFSGTFAAVNTEIAGGGPGKADDLQLFPAANNDYTGVTANSRLWFTDMTAAADHASALPTNFRFAPEELGDNESLRDVEQSGCVQLLRSPATSVYSKCVVDPWTTVGATIAGDQLANVMGCGDGHKSVGEILEDALGDPRTKTGARPSEPLTIGDVPVLVADGRREDGSEAIVNAVWKRYRGQDTVYPCIVLRTGITAAEQADLALEITYEEIDTGYAFRTAGSQGQAEVIRGQ
jgi:hypothetical protein